MRSICVGFCAALLAGYAVPALAQQPVPPPSPPEVAAGPPTTFFASGFDITLSPRVWFTTTVFNQPKSTNIFTVPGGPAPGGGFINNCPAAQCLVLNTTHNTDVSYPLFGISAIVAPRVWQSLERPVDFSVTVLGGTGQGTQTHLTVITPNGATGFGVASRNGYEDNRVDVEAVARTALSSTTRLVYGLRTIWRENVLDNANNPLPTFQEIRQTSYYPIAEVGVQLAAPITADGAHSLFAGIVGGPGYQFTHVNAPFTHSTPNSAIGFLDFNIGYQYSFNEMLSAYVRYRGQVFALTHGGPFLEQVTVIHGPEIAVTLRF